MIKKGTKDLSSVLSDPFLSRVVFSVIGSLVIVLSFDHTTSKEPTIQAFDCLLSTFRLNELNEYFYNYLGILLFTLRLLVNNHALDFAKLFAFVFIQNKRIKLEVDS